MYEIQKCFVKLFLSPISLHLPGFFVVVFCGFFFVQMKQINKVNQIRQL